MELLMEPLVMAILAGALGGLFRSILGFLGEREPEESFDLKKCVKSILRAVIGGAILGYWLQLDFKSVFFASFMADVATKNVWDLIKPKKEQ